MKKLIFLLVLIMALNGISQAQDKINTSTIHATGLSQNRSFKNVYAAGADGPKDRNFYLQRSRNLRITGLSLLGAGLLLGGAGLLVATTDHDADYITEDKSGETATVLFVCSAATGIASIPLMIMAHVNKSKARLMIGNQKTGFGVPSHVSKNITGVTIAITLGK